MKTLSDTRRCTGGTDKQPWFPPLPQQDDNTNDGTIYRLPPMVAVTNCTQTATMTFWFSNSYKAKHGTYIEKTNGREGTRYKVNGDKYLTVSAACSAALQ